MPWCEVVPGIFSIMLFAKVLNDHAVYSRNPEVGRDRAVQGDI